MEHLKYDVVIIGAGMIGIATAYELAKQGAKVAVLERKRLGDSCSVSNTALVIKSDPEPGKGLELTVESLRRFPGLSRELDCDIEYEEADLISLVSGEEELPEAYEQIKIYSEAGFDYRMASLEELKAAEPALNTQGFLGAVVSRQARINPFNFLYGYYRGAVKNGMHWYPDSEITGFSNSGKYVEIATKQALFKASKIVVAAGAWTRDVVSLLGIDLPIHYVHGEAIVTEALPRLANGIIGELHCTRVDMENEVCSLAGKNAWYGPGKTMDCFEFVINQVKNGNVILGQRSFARPHIYDGVSEDSFKMIAEAAVRFMPALANASIIRSWVCPVPFTPDHRAFVGPLDSDERIIISAGYLSTIILTPLMGELVARLAQDREVAFHLDMFNPNRFLTSRQTT